MIVAFFSHAGNTQRFVDNYLMPALLASPVVFPSDPPEVTHRGALMHRIEAAGPHRDMISSFDAKVLKGLHRDEAILVVFPVYAREDYQTGNLLDTVPKPVQQFMDMYKSRIVGCIVCGNRTFGKHYAITLPDERRHLPIVGSVELAGTSQETKIIMNNLKRLSKGEHNE